MAIRTAKISVNEFFGSVEEAALAIIGTAPRAATKHRVNRNKKAWNLSDCDPTKSDIQAGCECCYDGVDTIGAAITTSAMTIPEGLR
jgi:hypothetical protein